MSTININLSAEAEDDKPPCLHCLTMELIRGYLRIFSSVKTQLVLEDIQIALCEILIKGSRDRIDQDKNLNILLENIELIYKERQEFFKKNISAIH